MLKIYLLILKHPVNHVKTTSSPRLTSGNGITRRDLLGRENSWLRRERESY